jgi:hypothetical protein
MLCKISEIDLHKKYVIEIQVLNCERRNCGLLGSFHTFIGYKGP